MAIKFSERILAKKMTEFKFLSWTKMMTNAKPGESSKPYVLFELDTPIEKVVSSSVMWDPTGSGDKVHPYASDVTEIKCMVELIDKTDDEWKYDVDGEDKAVGSGSYSGDLLLDMSNRGEVWLTDESFAHFGSDTAKKNRLEKFNFYRTVVKK